MTQRTGGTPPLLREIKGRLGPPRQRGEHLNGDDRLVILWGMSRGWSDYRIARQLQCHRSTVWRYKQRLNEDPSLAFYLPLVLVAGKRDFRCRFCGETRATRVPCIRHVLAHFLPLEIAQACDISEIKRLV